MIVLVEKLAVKVFFFPRYFDEILSEISVNDRISEMVSFELGKEIEKDVFRPVTSVGQDEKIQSP